MIGHDVLYPSYSASCNFFYQVLECFSSSEFVANLAWIGNIITMRASAPRLKNGRSIDVGNAELREVRKGVFEFVEIEFCVELYPVGGYRLLQSLAQPYSNRFT